MPSFQNQSEFRLNPKPIRRKLNNYFQSIVQDTTILFLDNPQKILD
jgi:hypothetical protein